VITLNLPDEILALANDTAAVAALPSQIEQRDPACIPVLAALLSIAGEGVQYGMLMVGAMMPHMPPDMAKQVRRDVSKVPHFAALVMQGESE
jgi:hypothetical protein